MGMEGAIDVRTTPIGLAGRSKLGRESRAPAGLIICLLSAWTVLSVVPEPLQATDDSPSAEQIREGIAKALPFLEREGLAWIKQRKCVTCHQIPFMLWSHNEARRHGFQIDQDKLGDWTRWSLEQTLAGADTDQRHELVSKRVDTIYQLILGSYPAFEKNEIADSYVNLADLLLETQQPNGSWRARGQLPGQKRPAVETNAVSTMWAVLALASAKLNEAAAVASRKRALTWLKSSEPGGTTEWAILRYLIEFSFGDPDRTRILLAEILNRQNPDGGWAWSKRDPSDALATGQVLYALSFAEPTMKGSPSRSATISAIRNAAQFLLATQGKGGSWWFEVL